MGMKFFRNIQGKAMRHIARNEIFRECGTQNLLIKLEEK
jgi:hypothetical protein